MEISSQSALLKAVLDPFRMAINIGGKVVTVFLSSYTNTVDKKGRVSVPAPFRAEMQLQSRQTVVVYAAPKQGFLYAWGYDEFISFAEKIKKLPPMSKQRQRLARTILAAARPLSFDGEGRILIPENLLEIAGIKGKMMFAGQGEYFTMWNPERYTEQEVADSEFYDDDIDVLSTDWDAV